MMVMMTMMMVMMMVMVMITTDMNLKTDVFQKENLEPPPPRSVPPASTSSSVWLKQQQQQQQQQHQQQQQQQQAQNSSRGALTTMRSDFAEKISKQEAGAILFNNVETPLRCKVSVWISHSCQGQLSHSFQG